MNEAEKDQQIKILMQRAAYAQSQGLLHTAKSWRDYAMSVSQRPAREIVFAKGPVEDMRL